MAKQKIADLPKEEQEKITAQLKELQIRGVYSTFTVEKAQELIKKAQENGGNESASELPLPQGENADAESEENDNAQNDAQDAENTPEDQKDDDAQENAENDESENEKIPAKSEKKVAKVKEEPKPEKVLKCHICLSRVIDGKCTGCGFELRK